MTTTAVLLIAGADGEAVLTLRVIAGADGEASMTLVGADAVEIRMVRDTSGSGWVSWDSHNRKSVLLWVEQLRAAGLTADEAKDTADAHQAFLYVGGEA
jgi:hypothetical protein